MLSTVTRLRRRRAPVAIVVARTPDLDAALDGAVGVAAQLLGTVMSTATFYLELAPDGRALHVVEARRAREHVAAVASAEPAADLHRELIDEIELRPALDLLRMLRHNLQLALSDSAAAREAALPAREMSRRARPLVAALKPVLG